MTVTEAFARCHHCHTCGTPLKNVLDGEEWCPKCLQYRRYRSHGWTHALADKEPCPPRMGYAAQPGKVAP